MAKIFISHSSEDKEIVDLFKNIILNAGLGISDNDIAYTSSPETGVPTGGNIPQYIKEHIADSYFVFFMISDDYRKSEVCLNEMGAAWALEKNVKPLLLHDVSFKSVGWLYGMNLCAKIDDEDRLDELHDEFLDKFDSLPKTMVWNKRKREFLAKMAALAQNDTASIDTPIEESRELGLLDYQVIFDNHVVLFNQTAGILTAELKRFAEKIEIHTKQLTSIPLHSSNMSRMRGIMMDFAKDMNRMSDAIDNNAPELLKHFDIVIENAINIQQNTDRNKNAKIRERGQLSGIIHALISTKDDAKQFKDSLSRIPIMEEFQNVSIKRLSEGFSTIIAVCDGCIIKATELLKA